MSDLVGNLEDWFSRVAAHLTTTLMGVGLGTVEKYNPTQIFSIIVASRKLINTISPLHIDSSLYKLKSKQVEYSDLFSFSQKFVPISDGKVNII